MNEIEKILLLIRNLEDENVLMALQLTEGLQLKETVRQALQPVEFIKAHFSQNAGICFLLMDFFDCKEEIIKSHFGNELQVSIPEEGKMEWKGSFNNENILAVLSWIDGLSEYKHFDLKLRRRLVSISSNILQNICNFNYNISQEAFSSLFTFYQQSQHTTVTSRNVISTNQVNTLKDEMDKLNCLDMQGVREYFIELRNKSGNISLLDIYRKSGTSQLHYIFTPIPKQPEYTIFDFSVDIPH